MRVDPNYIRSLAGAIDQSTAAEDKLTTELSSGLSVTSLQDNPVAAAQSSLIGSSIAQDDSYVQTASNEEGLLQVTDSTLGDVVTQVTSAISLAVQGSNGAQSAAGVTSVQQQLSGILDQVLSLGNTSYLGNYIFSGSQGSTQPFVQDTSTVPATTTYAGDSNVQSVTTPSGQSIQVNLPGSTVLGAVFTALNDLIADFSGGTASASATSDTNALTTALSQLSSQRSALDSSLSRLQSTSTYVQTEETQLKAQQSGLVASDPATVATQLSSAETQHQALLSVVTGLEGEDLFSLMK